jgi:hypothetical protein
VKTYRSPAAAVFVVCVLGLSGCASAKRDLEAPDYWPSGGRWKRATMNALTSRGTWVPLIGAGVVTIDDWDQEISDWAVENTPVFGAALGNFVAIFVHDAFLPADSNTRFNATLSRDEASFSISFAF